MNKTTDLVRVDVLVPAGLVLDLAHAHGKAAGGDAFLGVRLVGGDGGDHGGLTVAALFFVGWVGGWVG